MQREMTGKGICGRATVITHGKGVAELVVPDWDLEVASDDGNLINASGTLTLRRDVTAPASTIHPGTVLDVVLPNTVNRTPADSFRLRAVADFVDPHRSADRETALDFWCTFHLQSGTIKYPGDT